MDVLSAAEFANMVTAGGYDYGNELVRLDEIRTVAVADIDNPATELADYAGAAAGATLVAYQADAATDFATLYVWDSADSGGADSPYVVAGSSGYWVAVAGVYKDGAATFKGDLGTTGVVRVDGTQVVGNQQAHIADGATDADAAVAAISAVTLTAGAETVDITATNSTLATMVSEINALKSAYNTLAGKYNTLATQFNTLLSQLETHGLNASS